MALKPLDKIGDDAFKDGFLNKERAQQIVDRLNTPWKVKLDGAPEAKVTLGTENNLINLTPLLGSSELCLLVDSGELRYGFVNIRWVEIA